jgi:hypothetical protein
MIARFTTVVALLLSVVWLCREPSWEPVIAVLTFFSTYLGIEIVHYRKAQQDAIESKYEPDPSWPGTAIHKQSGERVCYNCLATKHAALPVIRDPDNDRWGCAGCHTQLNPL